MLDLLDSDAEEDYDDRMDEMFFPRSDDELGFVEEEIDDGRRLVKTLPTRTYTLPYITLPYTNVVEMMIVVEVNAMMTVALVTAYGKHEKYLHNRVLPWCQFFLTQWKWTKF